MGGRSMGSSAVLLLLVIVVAGSALVAARAAGKTHHHLGKKVVHHHNASKRHSLEEATVECIKATDFETCGRFHVNIMSGVVNSRQKDGGSAVAGNLCVWIIDDPKKVLNNIADENIYEEGIKKNGRCLPCSNTFSALNTGKADKGIVFFRDSSKRNKGGSIVESSAEATHFATNDDGHMVSMLKDLQGAPINYYSKEMWEFLVRQRSSNIKPTKVTWKASENDPEDDPDDSENVSEKKKVSMWTGKRYALTGDHSVSEITSTAATKVCTPGDCNGDVYDPSQGETDDKGLPLGLAQIDACGCCLHPDHPNFVTNEQLFDQNGEVLKCCPTDGHCNGVLDPVCGECPETEDEREALLAKENPTDGVSCPCSDNKRDCFGLCEEDAPMLVFDPTSKTPSKVSVTYGPIFEHLTLNQNKDNFISDSPGEECTKSTNMCFKKICNKCPGDPGYDPDLSEDVEDDVNDCPCTKQPRDCEGRCPDDPNYDPSLLPGDKDECGVCGGNGKDCFGLCPGQSKKVKVCEVDANGGKSMVEKTVEYSETHKEDACGVCQGCGKDCNKKCPDEKGYEISKTFDDCCVCGGDGPDCSGSCPADSPEGKRREQNNLPNFMYDDTLEKDDCGYCGGPENDCHTAERLSEVCFQLKDKMCSSRVVQRSCQWLFGEPECEQSLGLEEEVKKQSEHVVHSSSKIKKSPQGHRIKEHGRHKKAHHVARHGVEVDHVGESFLEEQVTAKKKTRSVHRRAHHKNVTMLEEAGGSSPCSAQTTYSACKKAWFEVAKQAAGSDETRFNELCLWVPTIESGKASGFCTTCSKSYSELKKKKTLMTGYQIFAPTEKARGNLFAHAKRKGHELKAQKFAVAKEVIPYEDVPASNSPIYDPESPPQVLDMVIVKAPKKKGGDFSIGKPKKKVKNASKKFYFWETFNDVEDKNIKNIKLGNSGKELGVGTLGIAQRLDAPGYVALSRFKNDIHKSNRYTGVNAIKTMCKAVAYDCSGTVFGPKKVDACDCCKDPQEQDDFLTTEDKQRMESDGSWCGCYNDGSSCGAKPRDVCGDCYDPTKPDGPQEVEGLQGGKQGFVAPSEDCNKCNVPGLDCKNVKRLIDICQTKTLVEELSRGSCVVDNVDLTREHLSAKAVLLKPRKIHAQC